MQFKYTAVEHSENIQTLFEQYQNDRGLNDFGIAQFIRLIKTFPALIVVSSDGFADLSEVGALVQIAAEGKPAYMDVYERELKNIYLNQGYWRNQFFKILKEETNEQDKYEILMGMIYAAASSTGSVVKNILLSEFKPNEFKIEDINRLDEVDPTRQFFSTDEKAKIIQLSEDLGLLFDTNLKAKIYKIFGS